jgi:hypothetical protein
MLRVVDYFCVVDRDGNGLVEFEEALQHCFPHVPKENLETLQKWLHPQKFDKSLFRKLSDFADSLIPSKRNFKQLLDELTKKCEELSTQSEWFDEARRKELTLLKKGFVSKFTLANIIIGRCGQVIKEEAQSWKCQNMNESYQSPDPSSSPNFFSTTIFVISSAIQKLSRRFFSAAESGLSISNSNPQGVKLYRGFKETEIPESLSGFCELGFSSSSRQKDIAFEIASLNSVETAKQVLILELETPIGGFADVKDFSQ